MIGNVGQSAPAGHILENRKFHVGYRYSISNDGVSACYANGFGPKKIFFGSIIHGLFKILLKIWTKRLAYEFAGFNHQNRTVQHSVVTVNFALRDSF